MEIVNRVARSGIEVYDLASLWDGRPVLEIDLASFLEGGLVLREKPFRAALSAHDWTAYADAHVGVHCSADAIVPTWAFMLVAARLHSAGSVVRGRTAEVIRAFYSRTLAAEDWERFSGRIVVVKGCSDRVVPESAYVAAMRELMRVARKVMYGEPCSSVPLWRQPKVHAN